KDMRQEYLCSIIEAYVPYGSAKEEWLKNELQQEIAKVTGFVLPITNWVNEPNIDAQEMMQKILDEVENRLEEKNRNIPTEIVKMVEKSILLQVLDQLWKEHIATLDLMRHTIVLRAYGQKDPLNEYKKEAFNMFSGLLEALKEKTTVVVCRTVIQSNAEQAVQKAQEKQQNIKMQEVSASKTTDDEINANDPKTWGKVARNDLCPCGSGKKFKHCHGKFE
ncbi:MAG: SEC-C domain-containing protein, partial [Alphaproteobacteria bacterium]|nr:SEC-C domain-containing protein [Alphaproteobacteria bacterium]